MDVIWGCTCVADPAHMPELHEENSALLLHCPYNGLPGLNLLLRPDAGNMRVAAATGSMSENGLDPASQETWQDGKPKKADRIQTSEWHTAA
jgi:hypothetical protein